MDIAGHRTSASPASPVLRGVMCGVGAGALWGLVFLAPALVHSFSPLELAIGRYLAYGVMAAILIAPRWRAVMAMIGRREWLALGWLSLAGNTFYYMLLSGAVQMGGIAMTSLVIGFLPVTVTIIGSRDHGAVPLRKLLASLLLCVGGAVCIGWQAMVAPASGAPGDQFVGLICAIGALFSWTLFAVGNSRWLARIEPISTHDWNLLIGVVTGAQSLVLIPLALILGVGPHAGDDWVMFTAVSVGVAALASIVGNALWNRASRLLPLTMVGQMILFETLFALLYAFLWEWRLPTLLENAAFALLVLGVLSCIAAHRRPSGEPLLH